MERLIFGILQYYNGLDHVTDVYNLLRYFSVYGV